MAVRKEFKLKIFSNQDFDELQRESIKIDDVTKRIEKAEKRLRARGALPKALVAKTQRQLDKGLLGGREEESITAQKQKDKLKADTQQSDFINKVLIQAGLRKSSSKSLLSGRGAPVQSASDFKKLQKQVALNTVSVKSFNKIFSKAIPIVQGAALNPIGLAASFGQSAILKLLPAGMVISIATLALDLWMKSYGKGGINDPRKPILDDVFSLIGIEAESNFASGRELLINPPSLSDRSSGFSNTQNLIEGQRRERLLDIGSGRS